MRGDYGVFGVHSDEKLVEMFQSGDAGAFDGLFERYRERIFVFLYRMVGSREDALDLSQDTFLSAYRSLDRWKPKAKFSTWLYAIAVNKARSYLRDAKRRMHERPLEVQRDLMDAILDAQPVARGKNPDEQYVLDAIMGEFSAGLDKLPEQQKNVFVLRHSCGLKLSEIAQALGLKEGTVKAHLFKAVSNLMKHFDSKGIGLPESVGRKSHE